MKAAARQHSRPRGRGKSRHYGLSAALKRSGLRAIDGRSRPGRELAAWRAAVVADLGGRAALSAAKLALIDQAATARLLLANLDRWLVLQASEGTLVSGRTRRTLPALRERQALADSLQRTLEALGLERTATVPALQTYIEGKK